MKKNAHILFLAVLLLSSFASSKTLINIIIEAESEPYVINTLDWDDPLNIISALNAEKFYSEATQRAENYCRQALGATAKTELLNKWTSQRIQSMRENLVIHNSSIRCSRELDLSETDPVIGKYLEYASWVLSIFSKKMDHEDDHQLVENTLKILAQVGAPAISTLWNGHVGQPGSVNENTHFLSAIDEIIDNNDDIATLNEIMHIAGIFDTRQRLMDDSGSKGFEWQKSNLIRRGKWELNDLWESLKRQLVMTINRMKEQVSPSYFGDLDIMIGLLNGFYYSLNDRVLRDGLNELDRKRMRDLVCEELTLLPAWALSIDHGREMPDIVTRYQCND